MVGGGDDDALGAEEVEVAFEGGARDAGGFAGGEGGGGVAEGEEDFLAVGLEEMGAGGHGDGGLLLASRRLGADAGVITTYLRDRLEY